MCAHILNALFSVIAALWNQPGLKEKMPLHVNKSGLQILPQGRFESEKKNCRKGEPKIKC